MRPSQRRLAGRQTFENSIDVVDAAAPRAAAGALQRRPQPGVGRQRGIGSQIGPRRTGCQPTRTFLGAEFTIPVTDEVDRADQPAGVDFDANLIAVDQFADRPTRQGLGPDVPDAGAGADAGKPGVGHHRHLPAERQIAQGRGDLINLLHTGTEWPAAGQHDDVPGLHRPIGLGLDRGHGIPLARKTRAGPV